MLIAIAIINRLLYTPKVKGGLFMVQVLKDELRQAILRNAQDEFLLHGYTAASLKRIAAKAGMSVGNLYRYYAGKEALFDAIVQDVYHQLEALTNSQMTMPLSEENKLEAIVLALTEIIGPIRTPLLILIDSSKGTKHEHAVTELRSMMEQNVMEHLKAYNRSENREVFSPQTAWPIAVAFLEGYIEIIRSRPSMEESKLMVRQYVLFWYKGLNAFI